MARRSLLSKVFLGTHRTPLPDPRLIYALALVGGVAAFIYCYQVVTIAAQKRLVENETIELEKMKQSDKELIALIRSNSAELEILNEKKSKASSALSSIVDKRERNEALLSDVEFRLEKANSDLARLRKESNELEMDVRSSKAELKKLETQRSKLTEFQGKGDKEEERFKKLRKDVQELETKKKNLEKQLSENLKSGLDEINESIGTLKGLNRSAEVLETEMKEVADTMPGSVGKLKETIKLLDKPLNSLKGLEKKVENSTEDLGEAVKLLESSTDTIESKISPALSQLEDDHKKLKTSIDDSILKAKKELTDAAEQLRKAVEEMESLKGEIEKTNSVAAKKADSQLNDVTTKLSSTLKEIEDGITEKLAALRSMKLEKHYQEMSAKIDKLEGLLAAKSKDMSKNLAVVEGELEQEVLTGEN